MPRKMHLQRVIRSAFSDTGWKQLMENTEFAWAVNEAETAADAEYLMTLGARILDKTDRPENHRSKKNKNGGKGSK